MKVAIKKIEQVKLILSLEEAAMLKEIIGNTTGEGGNPLTDFTEELYSELSSVTDSNEYEHSIDGTLTFGKYDE